MWWLTALVLYFGLGGLLIRAWCVALAAGQREIDSNANGDRLGESIPIGGGGMNTQVYVRLISGGPWRCGLLYLRGNYPVLLVGAKPRGPAEVDCVVVSSACPIEMLDAAVETGFYVVGQLREVAP